MAVRQRRIQRRLIRMNNTLTTFLFPVIGALIFAAISAAGWYAMVYYSGYEIGLAAAAVGALCGIGAAMGSPDDGNWWSGSVAVAFALIAIYTAKVALYGPTVSSTFNFYDGIWGLFAVFAAWHIGTGQYGS